MKSMIALTLAFLAMDTVLAVKGQIYDQEEYQARPSRPTKRSTVIHDDLSPDGELEEWCDSVEDILSRGQKQALHFFRAQQFPQAISAFKSAIVKAEKVAPKWGSTHTKKLLKVAVEAYVGMVAASPSPHVLKSIANLGDVFVNAILNASGMDREYSRYYSTCGHFCHYQGDSYQESSIEAYELSVLGLVAGFVGEMNDKLLAVDHADGRTVTVGPAKIYFRTVEVMGKWAAGEIRNNIFRHSYETASRTFRWAAANAAAEVEREPELKGDDLKDAVYVVDYDVNRALNLLGM